MEKFITCSWCGEESPESKTEFSADPWGKHKSFSCETCTERIQDESLQADF
jgi:hypothetical protein